LEAANELERKDSELGRNTNEALAHPNDREAQSRFRDNVKGTRDADARIVVAAHPHGEQQVLEAGKGVKEIMNKALQALAAGDVNKAQDLLNNAQAAIKRNAALCRALAIRTTDKNKKLALFEAAMQLQNCLGNLLGPIMDMLAAGDLTGAMELLNRIMNDYGKADKKLNDAMAPKPVEVAPRDEIEGAAFAVQKAIKSKDFDESTPEGRLYAAARRVADDMILLSDASRRNAKSEIILLSRRIAQYVADIFKNAQAVSDKCKDPILKDQVMSIAHAVRNITVQLKIITAVKAATDSEDSTVRAQLVKCAKSLASNVVSICNAAEIASIKF